MPHPAPTTAAASAHVEAYRSTGSSPGRAPAPPTRAPAPAVAPAASAATGRAGTVSVPLRLERGGTLHAEVAYERIGPPDRAPIVVLGGISAHRHLAPTAADPSPGWWPGVVGADGALDPRWSGLLGVDWVVPPSGLDTPRITSRDQARALAGVLDHLGIDRVPIVGASYGGMVALSFAELAPERVSALVVLCAAHRTHPMATALRAIQRRVVRLARDCGRPLDGLALGRALAMTTYRSALEFDRRFDWRAGSHPVEARFPVESYLEARGDDFAGRFSTDAFLGLSESIDSHEADPERVGAPTTLVSFDTDALVPPWLVDELAARLPALERHVTIETVFGHDGFLKEAGLVSDVLRAALRPEVGR